MLPRLLELSPPARSPLTPILPLAAPSLQAKSPNCLCGLIPAPGGFRKAPSLWAKEADVVAALGPDPALHERKVGGGEVCRRSGARIDR